VSRPVGAGEAHHKVDEREGGVRNEAKPVVIRAPCLVLVGSIFPMATRYGALRPGREIEEGS